MTERTFIFPEPLANRIATVIGSMGFSLAQPKAIAQGVMEMSDHFQTPSSRKTPWTTVNHQAAYLAYFLPLNFLRISSVFAEAQRVGFPFADQIYDFGSGPGTAHLAALHASYSNPQPWTHIESSPQAQSIHKKILLEDPQPMAPQSWVNQVPAHVPSHSTLIASYSLNELEGQFDWIHQFDHLVFLEPSTNTFARRLMGLRQQLIEQGYFAWAPCTHQLRCPLLGHSPRDWCHDRIAVKLPFWFDHLEEFLPMRNRTLTFSYLLMSKESPPEFQSVRARVIGDTLKERGKWRQAVCRGPQREFLSWLTRHGEPEVIPHGELIIWPQNAGPAGNEWRPGGSVQRVDS